MAGIHISDIEAAINLWRAREPVDQNLALRPELAALAEVYALMVYHHQTTADEASMPVAARMAWMAWFERQPDTPCIAICSTSQGDEVCKGCGRYFDEVQRWTEMSPAEKRVTWRRITLEGDSWRFNRYAERALEASEDREDPLAVASNGQVLNSTPRPVPSSRPGSGGPPRSSDR